MNNVTIEMLKEWLLEQPDDITYEQSHDCRCFVAQYYKNALGMDARVVPDGIFLDTLRLPIPTTSLEVIPFNSDRSHDKRIRDFISLFDGGYDGIYDSVRDKAKILEILQHLQSYSPAPQP